MRWLTSNLSRKRLRLAVMIVGMIIALIGFAEVVDDVFYDPLEGDHEAQVFDQAILNQLAALRSPSLNQIMTDLTALGSVSVVLTLFFVLASVLASYRDRRGLIYLTVMLSGAGAWPVVLKSYFARVRPTEIEQLVAAIDYSFPSGHAFGAAALYIALAFYSGQYAKNWLHEVFFYALGAMLILIVGVSRIYLGVHYPTDVLAGISSGAAWGLGVSAVFEFLAPTERWRFGGETT